MGRRADIWIIIAGISGLIAVAAGAYGAHGLSSQPDYLVNSFNTGVDYHMWHTLALLGVAWLVHDSDGGMAPRIAGAAFVLGIFLFSGSLYVFGTTADIPFQGSAPAGGMLLMAGWAMVAVSGVQRWRRRA